MCGCVSRVPVRAERMSEGRWEIGGISGEAYLKTKVEKKSWAARTRIHLDISFGCILEGINTPGKRWHLLEMN